MKKDLIIIAGWSFKPEVLAPIGGLLNPAFRVHLVSLGDLDPIHAPESPLTGYRDGLLSLIDGMEAPPIVAGWSMGGMVALEAAAAAPEKIEGLALMGTTARFCRDDDRPWATPPAALRTMKSGARRHPEDVLDGFLQANESPAVDLLSPHPEWTYPDAILLCHGLDYLEKVDLRGLAPKHRTILLHGDQDAIIPVQAAHSLLNQLPNAELAVFKDVGHALPVQCDAEVAQEIHAAFAQD